MDQSLDVCSVTLRSRGPEHRAIVRTQLNLFTNLLLSIMRAFRSISFPLKLLLGVALLAVVGCDSSGPSSDGGTVEVGFATATSSSSQNTLAAQTAGQSAGTDSLVLSGSNGTLKISDLRLVVDKVKLEQNTDSTGADGEEVEIEREVEVERPSFIDLPLQDGEVSPIAAGTVPSGTYTDLEFEVDDLDDDEGASQEVLSDIREEFPNWPEDASMIVVGTFTPTNDTSRSFATYFEAEIEVERGLNPALEVTDGEFSRELIVKLDPVQWFEKADGTVQDLSQSDFEETGQIIEFEAEFEEGVAEIEFGD